MHHPSSAFSAEVGGVGTSCRLYWNEGTGLRVVLTAPAYKGCAHADRVVGMAGAQFCCVWTCCLGPISVFGAEMCGVGLPVGYRVQLCGLTGS